MHNIQTTILVDEVANGRAMEKILRKQAKCAWSAAETNDGGDAIF